MARALDGLCQQVAAQVSVATLAGRTERPTLTIS
jgi:hypothetical protein